jgi:hypothetical protein
MGWNSLQSTARDWDRMGKEETRCANFLKIVFLRE